MCILLQQVPCNVFSHLAIFFSCEAFFLPFFTQEMHSLSAEKFPVLSKLFCILCFNVSRRSVEAQASCIQECIFFFSDDGISKHDYFQVLELSKCCSGQFCQFMLPYVSALVVSSNNEQCLTRTDQSLIRTDACNRSEKNVFTNVSGTKVYLPSS